MVGSHWRARFGQFSEKKLRSPCLVSPISSPVAAVPAYAMVTNDRWPEISDPNPGPEHIAAARETMTWLEQALLALPLAQREVLILSTIVGLRQQEIAQSLNLPLNTVKTHLRRARLKLADAMEERETLGCTGDTDDQL